MSTKENPSSSTTDESRKGLSKEAWVAIGTISAALITGIVTLIIHLSPQQPKSNPAPTVTPLPATASPSQLPPPSSKTADSIAGKWSGTAKDNAGKSFQITLEIRKSCAVNERCGLISVSHVPCYGEVFLEKAEGKDFEFRVANFYGQSNRAVCQPGAGEHFHLRPDGRLDYTTTYEPQSDGILQRTGD
jgi:hypothetical protein